MSGGYFDYKQFQIDEIARELTKFLRKETDSDYDKQFLTSLKDETVTTLYFALFNIKQAAVLAHRIDYLLSGDDGEDSFQKRIVEDLDSMEKELEAELKYFRDSSDKAQKRQVESEKQLKAELVADEDR